VEIGGDEDCGVRIREIVPLDQLDRSAADTALGVDLLHRELGGPLHGGADGVGERSGEADEHGPAGGATGGRGEERKSDRECAPDAVRVSSEALKQSLGVWVQESAKVMHALGRRQWATGPSDSPPRPSICTDNGCSKRRRTRSAFCAPRSGLGRARWSGSSPVGAAPVAALRSAPAPGRCSAGCGTRAKWYGSSCWKTARGASWCCYDREALRRARFRPQASSTAPSTRAT